MLLKFCNFGKKKNIIDIQIFLSVLKIIGKTIFVLRSDIVLSCPELPSFSHRFIGNTDSYRLEP